MANRKKEIEILIKHHRNVISNKAEEQATKPILSGRLLEDLKELTESCNTILELHKEYQTIGR